MTNPFKKIAPALGIRGVLFSLLGLILLARAVPTLLSMEGIPDIPAAAIGIFLLTLGVIDLVRAAQRLTRLRKEKLDFNPIDFMYVNGAGGQKLPPDLMAADDNPNERNQPDMIEWVARVFPTVAFVPRPYTGALHAVLIAFSLGVLGVVSIILLRVMLAGSTPAPQLEFILDWSMWIFFVLGFVFWAALSRYGFRRALHFGGNLRGGRMVAIFIALLAAAIFVTIGSTGSNTRLPAPPDMGMLNALLIVGSLVVVGATVALVFLRARRAPESYSTFRGEEFFTVGMHPTDMINVIKSFTGKMSGGGYMHLGSWKPEFAEHTVVSAGEFEANLNAESGITLSEGGSIRPEKGIGTALSWAGLTLTALAGLFLFRAAGIDWASDEAVGAALRTPIGLMIFGALFYRLGLIPVSEMEWTSVITNCLITGTFQAQSGMALMSAGDHSIKGSVLTNATVQPRCAYLTSVGFLRPGAAKHKVPRLIDKVEQAEQVSNEILAAIHNQARQMMSVGTQLPPMQITLPDNSGDGSGQDDAAVEDRPEA